MGSLGVGRGKLGDWNGEVRRLERKVRGLEGEV